MNNYISCFIQSAVLAASCFSPVSLLAATPGEDFAARLAEKFPATAGAKIERAFPGFYSVIKNGEVLYFSDDITTMINGDVINLATKESLTQKLKHDNQPKIVVKDLPLADAFKIGSGSRKLYVFADPDCPWCRKLQVNLNELKDTEIYIFLLPITQLHPNAGNIAVGIWCQQDRGQAWLNYMNNHVNPPVGTCETPIERNAVLAQKLGIYGTPGLVFGDGTLMPGYMPLDQINGMLAKTKS